MPPPNNNDLSDSEESGSEDSLEEEIDNEKKILTMDQMSRAEGLTSGLLSFFKNPFKHTSYDQAELLVEYNKFIE